MRIPDWIICARNRVKSVGLRLLSEYLNGGFSVYFGNPSSRTQEVQECEYRTADGRIIPVYRSYRYSIKAGWRSFPGLDHLAKLDARGCLVETESAFLQKAMGTRTVMVAPDEAMSVAEKAVERNLDLFLPGSQNDQGLPEFRPEKRQLQETVRIFRRRHAAMFEQLAAAGIFSVPRQAKVLEIGYTTGGHSIFAFEQLGFKAFGIDNYYGGLIGEQTLHGNNKFALGSNVTFETGDITTTTSFPSESMDLVFSASVLEHIQDLAGAFVEMYRLLKPGGAIIHNYSPYFSHDGGHALGIGDSPWAHVRLCKEEYLRYLRELRPNEYAMASEWIAGALHRDMPQWKVQRLAVNAGFRIGMWMAKPSPRNWLDSLTPEIMKECFAATPGIGIEDLISRSVSFVGIKQ
jgi:SAM-dependent methyltransferase